MDLTERFAALVQCPAHEIALAEAALCIAGHDHAVDVDANLAAIDALAADVPDPEQLAAHLFTTDGSAGQHNHVDPRP